MRVGSLGPCCVDLDEMHYAGLANVLSSRSRLGTLAGIEASPGGSRVRFRGKKASYVRSSQGLMR